jgi:hypothetical protein
MSLEHTFNRKVVIGLCRRKMAFFCCRHFTSIHSNVYVGEGVGLLTGDLV